MTKTSRLHYYLTSLGTLPFLGCALLLCLSINKLPYLGEVITIIHVYGLVIVSFMAGIYWGQELVKPNKAGPSLLIPSNAIALSVWLAYLSASLPVFTLSLIIIFLLLLWIDFHLYTTNTISRLYFKVRVVATSLVVFSLIVVFFCL